MLHAEIAVLNPFVRREFQRRAGPDHAAFSSTVWRSAIRVSALTSLSISRIESPSALRRAIDGRSRPGSAAQALGGFIQDQQFGLVISARPIASICCSPPESWLPKWWLRSARWEESEHALEVHGSPAERFAAVATRFLAHGQVWKDLPSFGHEPRPLCAIRYDGRPRIPAFERTELREPRRAP
jgi:hypothetical protein